MKERGPRAGFREYLPFQSRVNKIELLDLRITKSDVWRLFETFSLTKNMRVKSWDHEFAEYLLQIGDRQLPVN